MADTGSNTATLKTHLSALNAIYVNSFEAFVNCLQQLLKSQ